MHRSVAVFLSALVVSALSVGCDQNNTGEPQGSSPTPVDPTTTTSSSAPTPSASKSAAPISLTQRCPSAPTNARPFTVATGKGERLYAVEAGTGPRAVVLIHGSGSRGLCNWVNEIPWLIGAGFRVIAFDAGCVGESTCESADRQPVAEAVAVVRTARQRGARSVAVVAASAGGPLGVQVAARPDAAVSKVVCLSPAGISTPFAVPDAVAEQTAQAAARARVPILYALAADDTAATMVEVSALQSASRTRGTEFAKLAAGSGHAQETLYDSSGQRPSPFRTTFLEFLRS